MKGWKHLLYLGAAIGMLAYAVPKLSIGNGLTPESIFGAVWICFALLIIAANLHELLGVDAETKERLRHVKRMRRLKMEERMYRSGKLGKQW